MPRLKSAAVKLLYLPVKLLTQTNKNLNSYSKLSQDTNTTVENNLRMYSNNRTRSGNDHDHNDYEETKTALLGNNSQNSSISNNNNHHSRSKTLDFNEFENSNSDRSQNRTKTRKDFPNLSHSASTISEQISIHSSNMSMKFKDPNYFKGLLISSVIIIAVGIMVLISTLYMDTRHDEQYASYTRSSLPLDLSNVIKGKFAAMSADFDWYPPKKDENGNYGNPRMVVAMSLLGDKPLSGNYIIAEYNQKTETIENVETLLDNDFLRKIGCYYCPVKFSKDLSYALVEVNKQSIYRHSFTAEYKAIDLTSSVRKAQTISVRDQYYDSVRQVNKPKTIKRFRYAQFGSNQASVVLFSGSQIFYLKSPFSKNFVKISESRTENPYIYSGIPDWVYEEEILESNEATWFSEDGNFIAWAEFNDQDVSIMEIPKYITNSDRGLMGNDIPQYPIQLSIPYPKPGTKNPTVRLFLTDFRVFDNDQNKNENDDERVRRHSKKQPSNRVTRQVQSSKKFNNYEIQAPTPTMTLLFNVIFTKTSIISIWSNRIQNEAIIYECSLQDTDNCSILHNLVNYKGWIDYLNKPIVVDEVSGRKFFVNAFQNFNRIIDLDQKTALTPENFHVKKILGVVSLNQKNQLRDRKIIYQGYSTDLDQESNKLGQGIHIYMMDINQTENFQRQCITCDYATNIYDILISSGDINSKLPDKYKICRNFDGELLKNDAENVEKSSKINVMKLSCKGPGVPFDLIYNFEDKKIVKVLTNNRNLQTLLKKYYTPEFKFFTIKLPVPVDTFANEKTGNPNAAKISSSKLGNFASSNNKNSYETQEFSARLRVPYNFFDDHGHDMPNDGFPLLVNVYAGPGQIKVAEDYQLEFHDWLVTNHDIAVLDIDGRGSYAAGLDNMFSVYKNLGENEIKDQISAVKQTLEKFPQINKLNVAIWGWSYGGYATLRALTDESAFESVKTEAFQKFYQHMGKEKTGLFKCGASVAPVTDWRLYDTAYTERYMDVPKNNKQGYDDSSLLLKNRASRLSEYDGKYLLMHGTMDDNVHFQQSALLEDVLIRSLVQHQVHYYTDKTHSIGGFSHRLFLYEKLTRFFQDCFRLDK